MTTERERLIKWAKQLADPNWCLSVPKEAKDTITALLKELEPRTVTTVEELNTLPFESVISDAHGRVFHRWLLAGWQSAGPTLGTSIALPATVLHEGSAS